MSSSSNLASDSFDVNGWITSYLSKVLSGEEDLISNSLSALDLVQSLIEELTTQINQNAGEIDTITQEIMDQLPKVQREIEVTSHEVRLLQNDIAKGLTDVDEVQRKTTGSMTLLKDLDDAKSKLLSASIALQEADKWTSLSKEIEQYLDSGDVFKSYECVVEMEKTLSVLNKDQVDERKLILEEMKNRLEALATKHLILAFDTNNKENSNFFFTMFTTMERTKQFVKYFQNAEKLKLCQEWRKIVEIMTFKESVFKFYDTLIDNWHSKIQWCKEVFVGEAELNIPNVLIELYQDTLRFLDPSLQFCFDAEAKKVSFIDLLIDYNQSTHRFAETLEQLVESQSPKPDNAKISAFLKLLFEPFLQQYSKYSKFYESLIVSKVQSSNTFSAIGDLSSSAPEATGSLQDRIEMSKQVLPEVILLVKENEERVSLFNNGYGYLHFGQGLNNGFERYIEWNHGLFRELEKSVRNTDNHRTLTENTLSFAETCGDILCEIMKLDQSLSANCGKVFGRMTTSLENENPWEDKWGYYLDSTIRSQILQFVQKKETLLWKAVNRMKKLCGDATQLVSRVAIEPIETQLIQSFSLQESTLKEAIPSEYITQIGEYLMLLPQNLEPFIASEDSSITYAFQQTPDDAGRSPMDLIISNLSLSIADAYVQRILKCQHLTSTQARQLVQDIEYLSGIFEDLGVHISADLNGLRKLLKNFDDLGNTVVTDRISSRLVSAIKRMKQ